MEKNGYPQIDLVYKYIDLTDPGLASTGRILKDFDNEELRYSLRSALENIPWVRKIFIIMPNEKVRFLKDDLNDRICYVKDSDLLGYDSASSITFELNLWRLREFGCSEYYIYANDDYFFGKPMSPSDFFYEEENGEFSPYVIYSEEMKANARKFIDKNYKFASMLFKNKSPHSMFGFYYSTVNSYKFICDIVESNSVAFPKHIMRTLHNAKPGKLSDVEKIYKLIEENYEYADECLHAEKRTIRQFNPHVLIDMYYHNTCNRKINSELTYGLTSITRCNNFDYNKSLFCINTGVGGDTEDIRKKELELMSGLFPNKSEYEK